MKSVDWERSMLINSFDEYYIGFWFVARREVIIFVVVARMGKQCRGDTMNCMKFHVTKSDMSVWLICAL